MPSVPDYTSVTDALSSDLLYLIRGSGTDRDKNITVSDLLKTSVALTGDQDIEGTKAFLDGVGLSSGRKFAEEKLSEDLASGLYVIAETDTSIFQTTTGFLLITVVGSSRRGAAIIEYSFTDNNPAVKEIKYISLKNAVNVPIKGIFLAYADATSQGCKILIDVDASTTVDVKVQNLGNLSHNALSSEATGINLVTATTTDNNLTPGGSTASYLEAGTVLSTPYNIQSVPVKGVVIDANSMVCSFTWPDLPKQNAASMTITDPTTNWIIIFSSNAALTFTGFTVSSIVMNGKEVTCTVTKTGAFSTVIGDAVVNWRTNGTGGAFILL